MTHMEVPFYSQHWDLDKWSEMGFSSRKEALYWQNSSCGVLCLKMACEAISAKVLPTISELVRTGTKVGAYSHRNGWSHKGLAHLARMYGLNAHVAKNLTEESLKNICDKGYLIIVSIKWAFQVPKKSLRERVFFWQKSGGHLALVIGYDRNGFRVNHTSTLVNFNWINVSIPFEKFSNAFTGRGLVVGYGLL